MINVSFTISFVSFHILFRTTSHSILSFRSSIVRTYNLHSLRLHPKMYFLRKKGNLKTINKPFKKHLKTLKKPLIRVKWFFVRTAARARSDPARDAGRLAMARSFHVNVRPESSLDWAGGHLHRSRPTTQPNEKEQKPRLYRKGNPRKKNEKRQRARPRGSKNGNE